jgi:DNA-binding MarR family transcriptional regulator
MDRYSDASPITEPPDRRFRLLNWIGIIAQLQETLGARLLAPLDLSMSEFVLLNHLGYRADAPRTVTQIARARQQPQPGVSKQLARLEAKGLIASTPHPDDQRARLVRLTPAGVAAHRQARDILTEMARAPFADWTDADLERVFERLDGLKCWFDENRPASG